MDNNTDETQHFSENPEGTLFPLKTLPRPGLMISYYYHYCILSNVDFEVTCEPCTTPFKKNMCIVFCQFRVPLAGNIADSIN